MINDECLRRAVAFARQLPPRIPTPATWRPRVREAVNDERNAEIARLRKEERRSYPEIASKFGISYQRVQQICVMLGVASHSRFDPLSSRIRTSIRRMVFAEVRSDRIVESIISRHHVTETSIREAIHEFTTERHEATRERAKRLYRKFKSTYRVAAKLGVTHTAAWHMLKNTGVLAPQNVGYPKRVRDRAVKLMRKKTIAAVAVQLGISKKTLSAWRRGRWPDKKKSRADAPARVARQQEQNAIGQSRRRERSAAVLEQERQRLEREASASDQARP